MSKGSASRLNMQQESRTLMSTDELRTMIRGSHPPARYLTSAEMEQLIWLLIELRETTQSRRSFALAGELIRASICGEPFGEIWRSRELGEPDGR